MIQTESLTFSATDLFTLQTLKAIPGNPHWANLKFKINSQDKSRLSGPGVYACFFEERLIYVGEFLGMRNAPFAGNICTARWDKHMGTLSLRGRAVSFSKSPFTKILLLSDSPLVQDLRVSSFDTVTRARGMVSSYERFSFAQRHWDEMALLGPDTLKKFSFAYVRLRGNTQELKEFSAEQIRYAVSASEATIIDKLQPICNHGVTTSVYPSVTNRDEFKRVATDVLAQTFSKLASAPNDTVSTNQRSRDKDADSEADAVKNTYITLEQKFAEEVSTEDLFREWIEIGPPEATDAVDALVNAFGDTEEVHFKKRSPADMRIRSYRDSRSGGTNIFTLQWRRRSAKFICHAYTSVENCRGLGFSEAQSPSANEPLNSTFDFDPIAGNLMELLAVVRQSIEDYEA